MVSFLLGRNGLEFKKKRTIPDLGTVLFSMGIGMVRDTQQS